MRSEGGRIPEAHARSEARRASHHSRHSRVQPAHIRRILELSSGELTFFMGDDDLLKPGALRRVGQVIEKHRNLGVDLRSYEQIAFSTGRQLEVFKYFPEDRLFAGQGSRVRSDPAQTRKTSSGQKSVA